MAWSDRTQSKSRMHMARKLIDLLETGLQGLAGFCLALVFLLVTAQVLGRFVFNISLATASELSIYAMIWSIFLGATVAFRSKKHIAMSFFKDRAGEQAGRVINVFVVLCLALFLGIIAVKGYDLTLRAMRQMSPAAGLPVGYVAMAMPICSALALIFLLEELVDQFRKA